MKKFSLSIIDSTVNSAKNAERDPRVDLFHIMFETYGDLSTRELLNTYELDPLMTTLLDFAKQKNVKYPQDSGKNVL